MAKPIILPDRQGKPLYVLLTIDQYAALTGASKTAVKSTASSGKSAKRAALPGKTAKGKSGVSLIRRQRERLGLTQTEVARRLRLTQGGYSMIEKSKKPRRVTVNKVAKALGVSPASLLA